VVTAAFSRRVSLLIAVALATVGCSGKAFRPQMRRIADTGHPRQRRASPAGSRRRLAGRFGLRLAVEVRNGRA
jgi:hypothetical protein